MSDQPEPQRRCLYDPAVEVGSERTRPDGTRVVYVEPEEYFVGLLGQVMNATVVFLNAAVSGRVPPDRLPTVDDAIADAYWSRYEACLTPPTLLRTLEGVAEGPSGDLLFDEMESAREDIMGTSGLEEAAEVSAQYRVQLLLQGADGTMTDRQVAVGELMVDYLLLQRAVAADIRRAEKDRQDGQPRAKVLEEMDRSAELRFEDMLSKILRSQRIVKMIPSRRRGEIEEFARQRRQFFRQGVLVSPDEE